MWFTLLLGAALAPGQSAAPPAVNYLPAPQTNAPPGGATSQASNGNGQQPSDGNGQKDSNGDDKKGPNGDKGSNGKKERAPREGKFFRRLLGAYKDEFFPSGEDPDGNGQQGSTSNGPNDKSSEQEKKEEKPPERRALPAPFDSPPFPSAEYQGFPLIGVPKSSTDYPLMQALYDGPCGDAIKKSGIKAYGWINGSYNWTTNRTSNTPTSYWIDANNFMLNQFVFRLEREMDTVQQDHWDWGFRATYTYGSDYRYFTAGGYGSDQLLVKNLLYGSDPTELHAHVYIPGVAQGMILTMGRWIATPDIETQFAPDNYMGTHSLLFTIDVYTETGIMATVMLDKQWTVQAAIHCGADMAPWYEGATPTGMLGVRWVSQDNNDSFYTVLNAINDAKFKYFNVRGVPAGHHNYNILQTTWQHRFNEWVHTKTEAYWMWERDAPVGGTPSIGPFRFNTGGGLGPTVPGQSNTYALLNYTMFKLSKQDFLTVRNEWTRDENGTRYGFRGNYSSHSIGWTHHFNSYLMVRPEVGYYRSYNSTAFDNGRRGDMWLAGADVVLRF